MDEFEKQTNYSEARKKFEILYKKAVNENLVHAASYIDANMDNLVEKEVNHLQSNSKQPLKTKKESRYMYPLR